MRDASDRKSKALIVACPVDVEVYDENNALVVKIVDNIVVKPEMDSDTVCAVMGDGEKVILLPEGHTYTMKLTATDEGSMDYTVLESYVDASASYMLLANGSERGQIFLHLYSHLRYHESNLAVH